MPGLLISGAQIFRCTDCRKCAQSIMLKVCVYIYPGVWRRHLTSLRLLLSRLKFQRRQLLLVVRRPMAQHQKRLLKLKPRC